MSLSVGVDLSTIYCETLISPLQGVPFEKYVISTLIKNRAKRRGDCGRISLSLQHIYPHINPPCPDLNISLF